MLRARRVVVAIAAAAATVAAFAGPAANDAAACSCAMPVPARDLPRFDAAFVGTAVSHRVEGSTALWTFDVERAVKGALRTPLTVKAASSDGACGLLLRDGQRTGLLLRADGARYMSTLCYQTGADALADVALPTARVIYGRPEEDSWAWWPIVVGAGALVTLTVGLLGLRRRA